MANVLKVTMQHSILTLKQQGHSQHEISRLLNVDRKTVRRYLRLHDTEVRESKSPISPPGDDRPNLSTPTSGTDHFPPAPKSPISTPGSVGRRSDCEPFRREIETMLEDGLSAQRIWQDLSGREGFVASYQSVKRFVRGLTGGGEPPFRRMESPPGREAQIDFGKGAPVVGPDGRRRRPNLFRMVLSHSGAGYSEVVRRQTTENFIRCIENGIRHFGGVPETLVIDNLKAAVTRADWYDPDIHPKIRDFCSHYGTVVLPTKPRTPRHKG